MSAEVAAATGEQFLEMTFRHFRGGQFDAEFVGKVEREAEVLVLMDALEPRVEVVRENLVFPRRHQPRTRCAAAEHVERGFQIQPRALRQFHRFAQRFEMDAADDLVDELERVPAADGTDVNDFFADRLKNGKRAFKDCLVASDHDGERGVLRADGAARDGRVEPVNCFLPEFRRNPSRSRGADGAEVYDNGVGASASEDRGMRDET